MLLPSVLLNFVLPISSSSATSAGSAGACFFYYSLSLSLSFALNRKFRGKKRMNDTFWSAFPPFEPRWCMGSSVLLPVCLPSSTKFWRLGKGAPMLLLNWCSFSLCDELWCPLINRMEWSHSISNISSSIGSVLPAKLTHLWPDLLRQYCCVCQCCCYPQSIFFFTSSSHFLLLLRLHCICLLEKKVELKRKVNKKRGRERE